MKTRRSSRIASNGFVLQPGHTTAGCRMLVRLDALPALGNFRCGASVSWNGTGVPVCDACRASISGETTGAKTDRRVFGVA